MSGTLPNEPEGVCLPAFHAPSRRGRRVALCIPVTRVARAPRLSDAFFSMPETSDSRVIGALHIDARAGRRSKLLLCHSAGRRAARTLPLSAAAAVLDVAARRSKLLLCHSAGRRAARTLPLSSAVAVLDVAARACSMSSVARQCFSRCPSSACLLREGRGCARVLFLCHTALGAGLWCSHRVPFSMRAPGRQAPLQPDFLLTLSGQTVKAPPRSVTPSNVQNMMPRTHR